MNKKSNSYDRLMKACAELKFGDGPSAIARQLTLRGCPVTEQQMTNWKNREGVSQPKIIPVAEIIGVRPQWLRSGEDPMIARSAQSSKSANVTPIPEPIRKRVRRLLQIVDTIDDDGLLELIGTAKRIAVEYPRNKDQSKAKPA